jgi:hypothetical protein
MSTCAHEALHTAPRRVAVALAYVLWALCFAHYHPVSSLAHVSSFFQGRPGGSAAIARLAPTAGDTVGYDGQFYEYIATDPLGARAYRDNPAYRYSRPVYPLAARALAGGQEHLLPWTLLLLGIAGVFATTLAVAGPALSARAPQKIERARGAAEAAPRASATRVRTCGAGPRS